MLYEIHLQEKVAKELKKMKKRAKVRYDIIIDTLNLIGERPVEESIPLQDDIFNGLRRAKAGEDRLFFMICEECRANSYIVEKDKCQSCNEIPDKSLMIFNIIHRRSAYKKRD